MITYKQVLKKGLVKEASTALLRYLTRNAGKLTRREMGKLLSIQQASRKWKPRVIPSAFLQYSTRPNNPVRYFKQTVQPLLKNQIKSKQDLSFLYPHLGPNSRQILDRAVARRGSLFGRWKSLNLDDLWEHMRNDLVTEIPVRTSIQSPIYNSLPKDKQNLLNHLYRLSAPEAKPGLSVARQTMYNPVKEGFHRSWLQNGKLFQPILSPDKSKPAMIENIDRRFAYKGTMLDKFLDDYGKGYRLWVSPRSAISRDYMQPGTNSVMLRLHAGKLKYNGAPIKYSQQMMDREFPFEKAYQGIMDNTSGPLNDIVSRVFMKNPSGHELYPTAPIKPTVWNKLYWGDLYNSLV